MIHPECQTPEHGRLVALLPSSAWTIDFNSQWLVEDVKRSSALVNESSFLAFAGTTNELRHPLSHHYTLWDYLEDKDVNLEREAVVTTQGREVEGFRVVNLLEKLRNSDVRLGVGVAHVKNLETLVSYYQAIRSKEV